MSTSILSRTVCFCMSAMTMCVVLCSCAGPKPNDDDVKSKLLHEYVCPQSAKIRHFEIVQRDEIKDETGATLYRYLVRGQVVWPEGCNDDGTVIAAGREQSFEQTVFLSPLPKGGWQ